MHICRFNRETRSLQLGSFKCILKIEGPRELSESIYCTRTELAKSHFVEHSSKLWVFLTEDVCQKDRMLDRRIPGSGRKRKLRLSVGPFRHRRQLEKVTRDDKLNTAKRTAIISYPPSKFFKFVKEITINHGYFINNQDLGSEPAGSSFLVSPDLRNVNTINSMQ